MQIFILALLLILVGCGAVEVSPTATSLQVEIAEPTATAEAAPTQEPAGQSTESDDVSGLTADEFASLSSLRKVDNHPLYVMNYIGSYERADAQQERQLVRAPAGDEPETFSEAWACSLFAAFGDSAGMLYGRNFDWQFSPALLLFMDPPDKYASVSMVDIEYLGFTGVHSNEVDNLPLLERQSLLDAPYIPFDGMNETGLVVGMAAVSPGDMESDPSKETIGSLGVIREVLDQASNTQEAVEIMSNYNIDMGGGPPLHYLIADSSGEGALVEFFGGEVKVIPNQTAYHRATNFIRSAEGDSAEGACWRYDEIGERLEETGGQLSKTEAMDLLQSVSQANTQWSIVYGMIDHDVSIAMGRSYEDLYAFDFEGNDK
jgi:hypothetical protein